MPLTWIHETPPTWDSTKASIISTAPAGIFAPGEFSEGDLIPGEWWRVEEDGEVLGYGWMDCTWGDAEMLLAVAPGARNRGVGTFILDRLEREAAARGLNYLYNVVRPTHPDREKITRWLGERGFETSHDDESLRRRVRVNQGSS